MTRSEPGLSVVAVHPADAQTWDRAWRSCPYATYFHSREWAEVWQAYTAGVLRPAPVQVTFSDGRTAVLPLSRQRASGSTFAAYTSSPAGTFGGWLSEDDLGPGHRVRLARYLVERRRDLVWRVNPYDRVDFLEHLGQLTHDETQALPLDEGFHAVLRRWTKGHRSAASKARREGVTVARAQTETSWGEFGAMYVDSVRRWGAGATSTYDKHLLELLRRREGAHVRLWLARHGDVAVAGALCLHARHHVVYWLGAALEAYFPLRPVHLLMYEIIEQACREGYRWFDFNPSGGHAGVAAFKKGFGPSSLPAPMVVARSVPSRLISSARRLLPR